MAHTDDLHTHTHTHRFSDVRGRLGGGALGSNSAAWYQGQPNTAFSVARGMALLIAVEFVQLVLVDDLDDPPPSPPRAARDAVLQFHQTLKNWGGFFLVGCYSHVRMRI